MRSRILIGGLLCLALAGCQQAAKPKPGLAGPATSAQPSRPAVAATPGLSPKERQRKAIELLNQGQSPSARLELQALLVEQPANGVARKLLDQIDRDPKALLGARSYAYRVRPGETMSALAERFLGDPLLFYALARYNSIAAPAQMPAGMTIRIPGVPKPPPRVAQPAPAAPAAPAVVLRDPNQAVKLRGQALDEMNRGAIDRAVGLLRQALQLDPNSAIIQRDLERALRIQSTVRGGPA